MAAVDRQDRLAGFSNFGARNVDLAAPGVDVTSTWPGGGWAVMNGTSMATPLTAGVAALLLGYNSGMTVRQLRDRMLAGAHAAPDLAGRVATGASIDAAGALRAAGASVPDLPEPAPAIGPSAPALPSRAPQTAVRTDRTAPTVRLRVLERRLRTALRRGLRAQIACSETCNAHLTLSVAGKSGTSAVDARAARLVATRTRAATVALRLNARARAAARSRGRIRLTVRAAVSDRAGNARRATVAVTLRR